MKYIKLPCYGISIELDEENETGTITSMLLEEGETDPSIDAIESLILAHAIAGIDVQSPAYIEGIETAIDAIDNH